MQEECFYDSSKDLSPGRYSLSRHFQIHYCPNTLSIHTLIAKLKSVEITHGEVSSTTGKFTIGNGSKSLGSAVQRLEPNLIFLTPRSWRTIRIIPRCHEVRLWILPCQNAPKCNTRTGHMIRRCLCYFPTATVS